MREEVGGPGIFDVNLVCLESRAGIVEVGDVGVNGLLGVVTKIEKLPTCTDMVSHGGLLELRLQRLLNLQPSKFPLQNIPTLRIHLPI